MLGLETVPSAAPAEPGDAWVSLFDFTSSFFTVTLPGQGLLDPLLFTWLQIKRVPFDFFDDVFLLHFSLEAAKGIFQCFTLL
jgi:hypothetical protein